MPRFPRTEADLADLIGTMLSGLKSSPKSFPSSDLPGLKAAWEHYRAAKERQAAAFEVYKSATVPKDEALDLLIEKTKEELRKAELDSGEDPAALTKIGWGISSSAEPPAVPAVPVGVRFASGRPRARLDWDPQARGAGGKVQAYEVERRPLVRESGTNWTIIAVVFEPGMDLPDQPQGVQEYRVVARNKSGASAPSVSVFLP